MKEGLVGEPGIETGCEGDGTWSIFKQVSMRGKWRLIYQAPRGPWRPCAPQCRLPCGLRQVWYSSPAVTHFCGCSPGAVPPLHFRNQREPQNKETWEWAVSREVACTEVGRAGRHGRDPAASVRTQEHLSIIKKFFEGLVSFIEHPLYTEPHARFEV